MTYLRQEIAAGIGPKLKRVETQLDTIESQLNLAVMTRFAELSARSGGNAPRPRPDSDDR